MMEDQALVEGSHAWKVKPKQEEQANSSLDKESGEVNDKKPYN